MAARPCREPTVHGVGEEGLCHVFERAADAGLRKSERMCALERKQKEEAAGDQRSQPELQLVRERMRDPCKCTCACFLREWGWGWGLTLSSELCLLLAPAHLCALTCLHLFPAGGCCTFLSCCLSESCC